MITSELVRLGCEFSLSRVSTTSLLVTDTQVTLCIFWCSSGRQHLWWLSGQKQSPKLQTQLVALYLGSCFQSPSLVIEVGATHSFVVFCSH